MNRLMEGVLQPLERDGAGGHASKALSELHNLRKTVTRIGVIARISTGPILCSYQKDKFIVDLDDAFLEELEEVLYNSDLGPVGTTVVEDLKTAWKRREVKETEHVHCPHNANAEQPSVSLARSQSP